MTNIMRLCVQLFKTPQRGLGRPREADPERFAYLKAKRAIDTRLRTRYGPSSNWARAPARLPEDAKLWAAFDRARRRYGNTRDLL